VTKPAGKLSEKRWDKSEKCNQSRNADKRHVKTKIASINVRLKWKWNKCGYKTHLQ